MISIVCVYNNEKILKNVLLKSLESQSTEYELITLDNRENRFKSASEALNYGGLQATGKYIMFAHQDMWYGNEFWLEEAEKNLDKIHNLGVAGVVGSTDKGNNWNDRARFSITVLFDKKLPATVDFDEVQTLDECVLIVPQEVFRQIKFDEEVFDGWDCYGADYCLAIQTIGKKAYVIQAGDCSHCCVRARFRMWEFKDLLKYQRKLYEKHRKEHKTIYSWMGTLTASTLRVNELMGTLGPIKDKLFPGYMILLKRELESCNSVLDLGCGALSPISTMDVSFSVGVEKSSLYSLKSEKCGIHNEYIVTDLRSVEFAENSFDAVIALDVLEYLSEEDGVALIGKMEKWACKKVIIKTSNKPLNEDLECDEILNKYKSEWNVKQLEKLGFIVKGVDGWNKLKLKNHHLDGLIKDISQRLIYYLPGKAAGMLATKKC